MSLASVSSIARNAPSATETTASIRRLISERAAVAPNSVAIEAPGRDSLTFGALEQQIGQIVTGLGRLGVGRADRVAIALANGPEMATAFLGTATAATAAPLNPQYTSAEFEFYLADLDARAVIVEAGIESPVRAVAKARGIPLLEIVPLRQLEAGRFEFRSEGNDRPASSELAEGEDIALILHTSGTTSRPKIIPLSHTNLCASAHNVGRALQLSPSDRCLNVMPLFHIHGLVAGLLAPLAAGGSVVCSPGFSSVRFYRWIEEYRPTWYTAVPAMHQEVLVQAEQNQDVIRSRQLRFIRSSSAALAPQVTSDLERTFGVPVIEAYGMTEAAHQIATNPLPPAPRKLGSVGLPGGPEVTILDEVGQTMPRGDTGEVALRGPNISLLGRPGAGGRKAEDWFRTGDLGHIDSDGYLFLSGRIKEIINRGGEKISPREIDEALLEHPGVAQAVACAVLDARLGEDVVAVVVRRAQSSVLERELREFASTRLAPFKVPRRIVFVEQIPKGPTGKIQRIGLAAQLGIESLSTARPAARTNLVALSTPSELVVADIFREALKLEHVSATDNFFELGGDSLASVGVAAEIEKQLGVVIDDRELAFGTVQQVAAAVDRNKSSNQGSSKRENNSSQGRGAEPLPLWHRVRRQTRKALVSATRPLAQKISIERYPGWFGTLHDFKVPNNVAPREWQGPGGGSNSPIVLQLLGSVLALKGDVAECGVWKGATLLPVSLFLKQRQVDKAVLAFDSFEGLGEVVHVDMAMGGEDEERKQASGFSDTSYAGLAVKVDQYGLSQSVKLVKGYFQDTLQDYADRRFCFVHLDCVLYESYKQCLEFFYPRMSKGGVILLDEYRDPPWPGCTKAVDEFVAKIPEPIEEIRSNNQVKFYIRKQ